MERFFLRRFHLDDLPQTLLTFGFLFIFSDLATVIWGGNPQTMPKPDIFGASVQLGRVLLSDLSLVHHRVRARCRRSVVVVPRRHAHRRDAARQASTTRKIARALGINVSLLFTLVFALGAFLAALGGVMGGPILGMYPGVDFEVLLLGFVVVIIGGLGSLKGALVGGLIVGLLDNFGKVFFPEFALFTIFAPMALILAIRPSGLFGRE